LNYTKKITVKKKKKIKYPIIHTCWRRLDSGGSRNGGKGLKLGWTGLLEAAETVGNGLKLGWTGLNCWRRQKQWANRQRLEA
jgi:hypothetical protein